MASVSRQPPISVPRVSLWRTATASAALPNAMPSAIEAATSAGDQVTRPGNSSAHMPV
jgi:hypothetical protein